MEKTKRKDRPRKKLQFWIKPEGTEDIIQIDSKVATLQQMSLLLLKSNLEANGLRRITQDKIKFVDFYIAELKSQGYELEFNTYLEKIVEVIYDYQEVYYKEPLHLVNSRDSKFIRYSIKKQLMDAYLNKK